MARLTAFEKAHAFSNNGPQFSDRGGVYVVTTTPPNAPESCLPAPAAGRRDRGGARRREWPQGRDRGRAFQVAFWVIAGFA